VADDLTFRLTSICQPRRHRENCVLCEAADEIDCLRAELSTYNTAEDVPPTPPVDAGHLDEAGAGTVHSAPASPRRCTIERLAWALDTLTDKAPASAADDAQLIYDMTSVLLDAVRAAYHYRTRGHREIDGAPEYLQLTSWVETYYAACADNVVRWFDL
jgi:hypothetical protein